jgi:Cys-rich repeat protein
MRSALRITSRDVRSGRLAASPCARASGDARARRLWNARVLLTAALVAASFAALAGCQVFDPIEKVDFCNDRPVVAATCPQCLRPPYAPECSQCQGSAPDDACSQNTGTAANSATGMGANGGSNTAANGGGNTGIGGGSAGTSGGANGQAAASGSPGAPGSSGPQGGQGPSGPAGPPGANGQPSAGNAGTPAPVKAPGCDTDADCSGATPACDMVNRACVQCTSTKPCSSGTCDTQFNRCVPCLADMDCTNGQHCDLDQRACFDCLNSSHCRDAVLDTCSAQLKCVDCENGIGCNDPAKPACVGQTCLECSSDVNCRAPKPRCSTDNSCVGCLAEADCRTDTTAPHCDVTNQVCVACLTDQDCPDPNAAHCESNTCVPCNAAGQCDHLTDKTQCDTSSGACVQCLVDGDCNGKACIKTSKTCSTIDYLSLPMCAACATDNECSRQNLCVEVDYTSSTGMTHTGHYCLNANVQYCTAIPPYDRTVKVPSIDGPAGNFCFPPSNTSCEAVLDAGTKACTAPRDCGLGMGDGICNIVGSATVGVCSYNCIKTTDCKTQTCTNLICQ